MDDTVQALVDELAIRNLLVALALANDTGSLDEYLALFAEDIVMETPAGVDKGREAIMAPIVERRAAGKAGPGSGSRHQVTPGVIAVHGDTATARSYFAYYTVTTEGPRLRLVGEYNDELRRTDAGWKVARRRVSMG